jgi:hypothetical protein
MTVMKVYFISCDERAVMIDKGTMVLQYCMDFLKVEPDSSSEMCVTSHDRNQVSDIKVKILDAQELEDPLLITLPRIKSENEVSFVSVHSTEWILKSSLENCCCANINQSLLLRACAVSVFLITCLKINSKL